MSKIVGNFVVFARPEGGDIRVDPDTVVAYWDELVVGNLNQDTGKFERGTVTTLMTKTHQWKVAATVDEVDKIFEKYRNVSWAGTIFK